MQKFKVIHESHARYLSDSEYRVLLSINMFQNVGNKLISVDMIAKDCLMGEKTVDRSLATLKERSLIGWDRTLKVKEGYNQWWNVYDINFELKLERPGWKSNLRLVDTRCFEGAPAWACWFTAVCHSSKGFSDWPEQETNINVSEYCGLDRRTVSKYKEILMVRKGDLYVMDNSFKLNGAMLFYKKKKVIKMIDICSVPENKKWGKS